MIAGVVVSRHRLRIRVDHDGLIAGVAEREGCLAATVVELNPLADAIGPAAQDHDAPLVALRSRLILSQNRWLLVSLSIDIDRRRFQHRSAGMRCVEPQGAAWRRQPHTGRGLDFGAAAAGS